jgi:hypothetical protein
MTAGDIKGSHATGAPIDCPNCTKTHAMTLKMKALLAPAEYPEAGMHVMCPTCSQGMVISLGHMINTDPDTDGEQAESKKKSSRRSPQKMKSKASPNKGLMTALDSILNKL